MGWQGGFGGIVMGDGPLDHMEQAIGKIIQQYKKDWNRAPYFIQLKECFINCIDKDELSDSNQILKKYPYPRNIKILRKKICNLINSEIKDVQKSRQITLKLLNIFQKQMTNGEELKPYFQWRCRCGYWVDGEICPKCDQKQF